jgi:hypothetical protein
MSPSAGIASRSKSAAFMRAVTEPSQKACEAGSQIPPIGAIIASGPIQAALGEYREKVTLLRQLAPNSDVAPALEGFCERLDLALREARDTDLYLTVDQVSKKTGRPRSTITRFCRDPKANCGAHKVKGVWSIHWPAFEAFLTTYNHQTQEEAA